MNAQCPVCGYRFEREQGFFQGAMYVSWVLGVAYLAVLGVLAQVLLVPRIGIIGAAACVIGIHLACIPAVFRYSRVIWAHLNAHTIS
jgi:O-antigen/teichoic acid export membrane protein